MKEANAAYWIEHLGLQPHPEGGYFKEVYRAEEKIPAANLPSRYSGTRDMATSIYYLLEHGQVSQFHHLTSDETWVHIAGDPLTIHQLIPGKGYHKTTLGKDLPARQTPQHTINRGIHFGAATKGSHTLVACFVAPGFDFNDFRFSKKEQLLQDFASEQKQIKELEGFFK